jgi:hypothetical protein
MEPQLSGSHRSTYDAVFQHPVSRNLIWRDVRSMLAALPGAEQQERNGTLKVTRNGHTLTLHAPLRKNVTDIHEVMQLRRFLENSNAAAESPITDKAHLLVVIDHRLARIYRTERHGSVPQRVIPYDRSGSGRHLHYVHDDSSGHRVPETKSFYEAVANTLVDADKILLFGSGTGASSAMEQLLAALKRDHQAIADRVVGCVAVDEPHLTEDQLLAQAREFYVNQSGQGSPKEIDEHE